jgi:peroxin-1
MITIQLLSEKRESDIVAQTKSLVEQGAARLTLGPVKIDCPVKAAPWRYPTCLSSQPSLNNAVASAEWDSLLAAWRNLPQGYEKRPLCHGSLIALPWSGPERREFWRVSFHTDSQETSGQDLFVRLEDVKDFLLRSYTPIQGSFSCNQTITVTTSSNYQILNWLPSMHDMITHSRRELLSDAFSLLRFCHGVVIYGEKGTGKTHTCLILAAISRLRFAHKTVYLDCSRLQSVGEIRMHETLEELSAVFEAASTSGPSLLILDNLDKMVPNLKSVEDGESSTNNLQVNPIEVDQTKLLWHHVYFLAQQLGVHTKLVITCNEQKSIAPGVFPSDRVYEFLSLPSLGTVEVGQMLSTMICQKLDLRSIYLPFDLNRRFEGYRPGDVERLSAIVCQNLRSKILSSKSIEYDDATLYTALDAATAGFVPISRQGVRDETSVLDCTWEDIGGLFEAKRHLTSSILHPVKYRRIYENAPTQLPRGLLLFGPPGCGKSLIVPALAKECDLTLITCHGPELLDKYIGASEHKVRQLFARAQAAAPSLLFLDEFEALAPRRGSDHTGVTDRVVNQLLTFLDGVESTLDRVYVVAATSRPDKIDPALLRPGRLEKHVYIGFPATEDEWTNVFYKLARSRKVEEEVMRSIESGNLYGEMIDSSVLSFSPADLKAVLDTAQLAAVHEYLENGSNDGNLIVTMKHVRGALHSTRPSLSADDRARFESLYAPFRGMRGDRQPKTLKTTLR